VAIKPQGPEADHKHPSRAELKNGGAIPPSPYTFIAGYLSNYAQEERCLANFWN
jgi:hypothetical protein